MKSRFFRSIGYCLLLLSAFSVTVMAASPVSKSRFSGVAIGGHDTVAYHELASQPHAQAVEGSTDFVVEYLGAKWHFASKESSERFQAEPEKFTPAYNGFCANALSLGEGLVRTDGSHWEIFDDALYLFYAGKGRLRWTEGDWASYKAVADSAWAQLTQ